MIVRVAGGPAGRSRAIRAMRRDGVVVLEGVLDSGLVQRLAGLCLTRAMKGPGSFDGGHATEVGHRRFMFTVPLEPPFADARLIANGAVLPVLRALLGTGVRLASFGLVVAFPGARAQHVHRDAPLLFEEETGLSARLPAHAVTLVAPLVDVTEQNGPTRVWPGSFAWPRPRNGGGEPVMVSRGDCTLLDYRLLHGGMANRSGAFRPILYITYARAWFRDVNFVKQQALEVRPEVRRRLPKSCRRLL